MASEIQTHGKLGDDQVLGCENLGPQGTYEMKLKYYESVVDSLLREWLLLRCHSLATAPQGIPGASHMTAAQPAPDQNYQKQQEQQQPQDDKEAMDKILASEIAAPGNPEVDLVGRALDILGSPRKLAGWMQASLPALKGQTPYSLMNSEEGRKQVETVLGRIEHGVF